MKWGAVALVLMVAGCQTCNSRSGPLLDVSPSAHSELVSAEVLVTDQFEDARRAHVRGLIRIERTTVPFYAIVGAQWLAEDSDGGIEVGPDYAKLFCIAPPGVSWVQVGKLKLFAVDPGPTHEIAFDVEPTDDKQVQICTGVNPSLWDSNGKAIDPQVLSTERCDDELALTEPTTQVRPANPTPEVSARVVIRQKRCFNIPISLHRDISP